MILSSIDRAEGRRRTNFRSREFMRRKLLGMDGRGGKTLPRGFRQPAEARVPPAGAVTQGSGGVYPISRKRFHMSTTRRQILSFAGVAVAAATAGLAGLFRVRPARAANETQLAIALFTKGALPVEGGVRIEAAEIADNGGAVPVRVSAEGARRIALFADGNPSPGVAVFTFGKWVTPAASTRIRLAGSQKLIAVAEMADGAFRTTSHAIKVTAGGC